VSVVWAILLVLYDVARCAAESGVLFAFDLYILLLGMSILFVSRPLLLVVFAPSGFRCILPFFLFAHIV